VKRYLVVEESVCPECEGTGYITNPCWSAYVQHVVAAGPGGNRKHPDEFAREECGEEKMPPEEAVCLRCRGHGLIYREVPLEEALKALKEVRHA